jgi:hypothetical protein
MRHRPGFITDFRLGLFMALILLMEGLVPSTYACLPYCGPCMHWEGPANSGRCVLNSGAQCAEYSDCPGGCQLCSNCQCNGVDAELCLGQCDQCNTSTGYCYDDSTLCSNCDICFSGSCIAHPCMSCQKCENHACVDDCSGCKNCVDNTCVPDNSQCPQCKYCTTSGECILDVAYYQCAEDSDCTRPMTCKDCLCYGGCDPESGDLCSFSVPPIPDHSAGYGCNSPIDSHECNAEGFLCKYEQIDDPKRNDQCMAGVYCALESSTACVQIQELYCYNSFVLTLGFICSCDSSHGSGYYWYGTRTVCARP